MNYLLSKLKRVSYFTISLFIQYHPNLTKLKNIRKSPKDLPEPKKDTFKY